MMMLLLLLKEKKVHIDEGTLQHHGEQQVHCGKRHYVLGKYVT